MSKPSKKLTDRVNAFNRLYPVGTVLSVIDDNGIAHNRKLLSPAWIIGNHSAIALFEGISGGYDITRVQHKMRHKTNEFFGLSYNVPCDANGEFLPPITPVSHE